MGQSPRVGLRSRSSDLHQFRAGPALTRPRARERATVEQGVSKTDGDLCGFPVGAPAATLDPLPIHVGEGEHGYLYHIELPGPGGLGVGEWGNGSFSSHTFFGGQIDDELAESSWLAYTKPAQYAKTGVRTFFINERGDILATNEPYYSRFWSGPIRTAAFVPGTFGITGKVAVGTRGSDGNVWRPVN